MTYFRTKTKATRLRMTRIARRQNDIETYASMTYFCTKTKATRLRIARMTRIIIANIIREIRVIRSSNHKVQSSNFKGESFSMSFCLFFYMDLLFLSKFMFNFANGFNYIHFDIFDIWITKEKLHQDLLRYKLLKNLLCRH